MISTFINAWKIADLRKKMLFTALIVVIFRIGAAIPVPFTNIIGDNGIIDPTGETFMNYLAMMTGDAFAYGTIFALSITPCKLQVSRKGCRRHFRVRQAVTLFRQNARQTRATFRASRHLLPPP